ncbi:RepB DNA-primase [Desulfocicer vacuolatum DSM 3385]|uniref:RepB DNA-primase n=1 Tax=Desulfocicer vacuolatum DSM 3385 TaxID=1121400 RepID=A0A1W2EYV2_9BACT|nr:DNA-primase RepB domain-containing protein [Desulfocicer vacuolatum]SMD14820.1 RepB DNA-primase [Desulfocicer vacuolatum DSM 3385]
MEKILWKLRRFFNSSCHLAVLDITAGKRWILDLAFKNIPYLKAENVQGRHILIQPLVQAEYLMADDITSELLHRHHKMCDGTWKPGRMVVETSPDNFQVWIHANRALSLEEKRYWLKKMKSDPGADPYNRWGRCPGFRNRKSKYRNPFGHYPLARLVWVDWKQTAQIPPPVTATTQHKTPALSPLPLEGGVCRLQNLSRNHYHRGDESATDFAYAVALFRRGMHENDVKCRILEQRDEWKNHSGQRQKEAYLNRTLCKAKKIVESS